LQADPDPAIHIDAIYGKPNADPRRSWFTTLVCSVKLLVEMDTDPDQDRQALDVDVPYPDPPK
jgi:hypothetical protein